MPTYDLEILIRTRKEGSGTKDAEQEVDNFGKRLNGTLDIMKNSAAAALAAGATFKQAFELGKEGASLNQLTESFELMNREVFHTPGLLEEMSEAARGTIKETDLMQGLLKLTAGTSRELSQEFARAAPQLLEIAKASNKLNPALGDTSFLYDSISTGIKRASPLILDNLGIVVKVGEANEKYAESLGKSVDQLTAEEKQIALLNAVLESGDQLINQVGGSVDSQTDAWARLEVQVGSAADALKQVMAERLTPAISGLTDFTEILSLRQEQLNRAVELGIISQFEAWKIIRGATWGIDRYEEALRDTVNTLEDLDTGTQHWQHSAGLTEDQVADLTEEVVEYADYLDLTQRQTILLNREQEAQALMQERVAQATERLTREEERRLEMEEALASATNEVADATGRYFEEALRANRETSLYGFALDDLGTRYVAVSNLTDDQREDLDRLRDAYDRSERTLRDYEIGLKGAGLETDELAEAMQEERDEMARLQAAMDPLLAITDDYVAVTNEATFNQAALGNALIEATAAATDDATVLYQLRTAIEGSAYATGEFSKAQLEAAFRSAAMEQRIKDLAEEVAKGKTTVREAIQALEDFEEELSHPYEIDMDTSDLERAINDLEQIAQQLDDLDGRHTRSIHTVETRHVDTGGGPKSGGKNGNGNGGNGSIPEGVAQHGLTDFIVPPGFYHDNYLLGLTSGERVNVTPAGQQSGSGATFYFDLRGRPDTGRAMDDALYVMQQAGYRADQMRRVG